MLDVLIGARNADHPAELPGYWWFQIAGWSAFALVSILSLNVWYNPGELVPAMHSIVQSAIGILVSHPLRFAARRTWNLPFRARIALNGAAVLIASQIWTVLRLLAFTAMTGEVIDREDWGGWIFGSLTVFSSWAFCYHAIKYYKEWAGQRELSIKAQNAALEAEANANREHIKRLEAENLVRDSRLQLLNYQISPHFFFNALNSVTALVQRGDRTGAIEMLSRIGDFLRISLESSEPEHSLVDEVHIANLYLGIEKIRFGDRLVAHFEIAPAAQLTMIPSLLLQPLLENCVKHAVGKSLSPTVISLRARIANERLQVIVSDNGTGAPTKRAAGDPPGGIGLNNVEGRLQSVYGEDYRFAASHSDSGGFEVLIELPVRYDSGAGGSPVSMEGAPIN